MYDSPIALEEMCLENICCNLTEVFDLCYENDSKESLESSCSDEESANENHTLFHKKLCFKDSEFYLCNGLSEKFLTRLGEKSLLNDTTLNLFTHRNTYLERVRIKNARKVTNYGLKILGDHHVTHLECVQLKNICVDHVLECLSNWSKVNLTVLNVAKCKFIDDTSRHFLLGTLAQLKNLKILNVGYTEFNQQTLQVICEDLQLLEKLDISGTSVNDFNPLLRFSNQLTSLIAADLHLTKEMAFIIIQLNTLQHLDVSVCNDHTDILGHGAISEILEQSHTLQNLVSLEISGWKDFISNAILETYIQNHAKLKYLGIVLNFIIIQFSEQFTHLVIAGVATEDQIKVTLQRHHERAVYVQSALYHLFQLTSTFTGARTDMFELVLPVMIAHPNSFPIQMAATACLYNLTKGDLSKSIHPQLLSKSIQLTLNAMDRFPTEYQLQKNSLLMLCSDRILQEVNFERFRCAKLVLDSLCTFSESNMNRMAVAICSILAAKVSTAETSELGGRPMYMRKLLEMVQNRVNSKSSDITLKFTLSALWNLTDECSATCTIFLEHGGASLFLNVLKTFRDDSTIETKVLGLLNNIAEVQKLRYSLMLNSLMDELHKLLVSNLIDVSYFAAGIVAHLASDGPIYWTIRINSREEMLNILAKAVLQWKTPETEMVAYRSFKPFFPLLNPTMDYQVQLWAVWAIHHVCTKNASRYCEMLKNEDALQCLNHLWDDSKTNDNVREILLKILDMINSPKVGL